jgi:hypothetical protein
MRSRLLLALVALPVLCAAVSDTAAAQSRTYRSRDHGRTYVYRTDRMGRSIDRGYRSRIYMPSYRYDYRYKEPMVRTRTVYRGSGYRYGNDYRYRDYGYSTNYRYRDGYYRDGYYTRRGRGNLLDLVLIAAGSRYRDRAYHRHTSRCRHGRGLHISL